MKDVRRPLKADTRGRQILKLTVTTSIVRSIHLPNHLNGNLHAFLYDSIYVFDDFDRHLLFNNPVDRHLDALLLLDDKWLRNLDREKRTSKKNFDQGITATC